MLLICCVLTDADLYFMFFFFPAWRHALYLTTPPRSEGVNVKRCFYLMIIHLKDWLTCQTAEGGLISSLMFRPSTRNSSSLSSSSPSNFFSFFDPSETADFVLVQFCPSFFSSVSTCPGLHSQNRISKRLVSLQMKNILMCVLQRIFKTHTHTVLRLVLLVLLILLLLRTDLWEFRLKIFYVCLTFFPFNS